MEEDFPDIITGNGVDRDLAVTANDRIKKTVIELRYLKGVIGELNTNILKFSASSDSHSRKLVFLTWVLVIFTVILVFLTFWLIQDAKDQVSSQNNIALNSQFFNPMNAAIIDAIQNNKPILVENHGSYRDAELDNYLGTFDVIQSSYEKRLLSESDLCDSFSYYINATNKNPEIQKYIAGQQKTDRVIFMSLSDLEKVISSSKNPNCK